MGKERSAIGIDSTIVASSDQVSCELDDDAIVLSLRDGVYYGLNPVAARIWSMIESPTRVVELRDRLLQEYEVEPERCTRDLLEVIEQLRAWDLVDVVQEGAARAHA